MNLFRTRFLLSVSLIAIGAVGYFSFFNQDAVSATPKKSAPTPLVSLTAAQVKPLPLTLTTQGHVVPLNLVDIQAQITGTVKSVAFNEGDFVQQGQLLFMLDDTPQQAALHRVQASKAQTQSLLDKAQRDLMRGQALKAKNYISASDWDALLSNRKQYAAQLMVNENDIRSAQAELGYTRIYAPVSGKTGALNVHPGSLVQPGSSQPLVTVSQFDPIGVSFTLPEKDLNAVLTAQQQGDVKVRVNNAKGQEITGTLDFIDSAVSADSGTILLKARFANTDHLLWPGAFQDINVDAGTQQVVVLPPQAVQNGPDGHFVYLVDEQGKAESLPVTLLRIQQQMAVVSGLKEGTRVITEGTNNLRPGMPVTVAKATLPAPVMEQNP